MGRFRPKSQVTSLSSSIFDTNKKSLRENIHEATILTDDNIALTASEIFDVNSHFVIQFGMTHKNVII